jgi:hypothetical protein
VANYCKDKDDKVAEGKACKQENIPLAIGFEVGYAYSVLGCVPLKEVWEVDFIKGKESGCTESPHSSK